MRDASSLFEELEVWRVGREAIRPARGVALARATGLWLWVAKNNHLFRRPGGVGRVPAVSA